MTASSIGRTTPSMPVANSMTVQPSDPVKASVNTKSGSLGPYSTATQDPSGYAALTPDDLALFASMYGPDALTKGIDKNGEDIRVPAFVADTMGDRKSGHLAPGQAITADFVRGVWDQYANQAAQGNKTPLSSQEFADALDFFAKRSQGRVDMRA